MLTIVDQAGFLHIIPRERIVSISMLRPEPPGIGRNALGQEVPTGDPAGTKMKLLICFDTGSPQTGQLLFFFSDENLILLIKNTLRSWAMNDAPNQLFIDAGQPAQRTPSATSAIDIQGQ